jgi:hypothetical protein
MSRASFCTPGAEVVPIGAAVREPGLRGSMGTLVPRPDRGEATLRLAPLADGSGRQGGRRAATNFPGEHERAGAEAYMVL